MSTGPSPKAYSAWNFSYAQVSIDQGRAGLRTVSDSRRAYTAGNAPVALVRVLRPVHQPGLDLSDTISTSPLSRAICAGWAD